MTENYGDRLRPRLHAFSYPGATKNIQRSLTPGRKNRLRYMPRGRGETHDLCHHPLVKLLTRGNAYFIS